MGILGFLGGFSDAATRSQAEGAQNKLQSALALYKLKHDLESDSLRRAYLLSRLNKPQSMGTGIKITDQGKQAVFYPQAGKTVDLGQGQQFYQSPSSASPITKSFQQYLDSKSLTRDQYLKLPPPQKQSLYREYRTTLSPDQQLKDAVLETRLQQMKQTMGLTAMEIPFVLDMIKQERASGSGAPSATPSDIVPGTPEFDPSDPTSFGAD